MINETPDTQEIERLPEKKIADLQDERLAAMREAGIDQLHILDTAREHVNIFTGGFQENITRGLSDITFAVKAQWSDGERSEFQRLGKTPLTFNKLSEPLKKALGEQRKNRADLMVRSLDGKATQEEINLRQDLLRTIAYTNQTDLIYQHAFKSAFFIGWGAFEVGLDYASPYSFKYFPFYNLITDPTRAVWDLSAIMPHKGDGDYSGVSYDMPLTQFYAAHPDIQNPVSFTPSTLTGNYQWVNKKTITVYKEYRKHWFPLTILELSDGQVVTESEWEEAQKVHHQQESIVTGSVVEKIITANFPYIRARRKTKDYKIRVYQMIKDQVISWSEWPSRQLGIIFVDGDSYYLQGYQYTKSFIADARDPQRALNYVNSEIITEIKNRRREQWLGTPANIKGQEQLWRNPELQHGILKAVPDPKTGQMPQKMPPWDMSPQLMQNAIKLGEDIKQILGFSEQEVMMAKNASQGAQRERKLSGGLATYLFFDNLNQAIAQGGRIVNDLLPYVIGDNEHFMNLSKLDGQTERVTFNKKQKDGSVLNTLTRGEFEIEISAGPSYAVQKDVALDFFQQTVSMAPQVFPLIADLWAMNLDIQFMPQMVERLKTLVPPNILAKEKGEPPAPPPPPSPEQQMQQMELRNKQQDLMLRAQQLNNQKKQHDLDEQRLQNETIALLQKMQTEGDKSDLDKSRFQKELTELMINDRNKHQERMIDLHKHNSKNDQQET